MGPPDPDNLFFKVKIKRSDLERVIEVFKKANYSITGVDLSPEEKLDTEFGMIHTILNFNNVPKGYFVPLSEEIMEPVVSRLSCSDTMVKVNPIDNKIWINNIKMVEIWNVFRTSYDPRSKESIQGTIVTSMHDYIAAGGTIEEINLIVNSFVVGSVIDKLKTYYIITSQNNFS